jgi:ATP-dependent HslUV protease ATP-binding subunit HslU
VSSLGTSLNTIGITQAKGVELVMQRDQLDGTLPRGKGAAEQRPGPRELSPAEERQDGSTRQKFRKKLREGELDDKEIEIELAAPIASMEILAPPGMEDLTQQLQGMFQSLGGGKKRTRKMKIKDAMKALADEEAARLINDEEVKARAIRNVEQNGIVFSTKWTRSPRVAKPTAPMFRARACSGICCRWSRARRCRPNTA